MEVGGERGESKKFTLSLLSLSLPHPPSPFVQFFIHTFKMKSSTYKGLLISSISLALAGLVISLIAAFEKVQYLVTVGVSILFAFVLAFGVLFVVGNKDS